ncbi:uncharacterized protein MELLADRAFT_60069 [Melampsora larici-populina 98AG31]|uniref:Uncharacterized protein n=1 Tax=Melampsora larici-populina (strain 98AG31 / pathotype 3-4-7) TaxID=747676 RepID=F4R8M6_MELLP|nr:uncharacterized protein MELLADRAFT_60069 [Melampsora larici-populina 98AG31]EGG11046.1 hypothetical protein MELLADRAFT_60069 [Melampsora larici-populina 98AG31]
MKTKPDGSSKKTEGNSNIEDGGNSAAHDDDEIEYQNLEENTQTSDDDSVDESNLDFGSLNRATSKDDLDVFSGTGSNDYLDDETDLSLAFENMDLDGFSCNTKPYDFNKPDEIDADDNSEMESSSDDLSEFDVEDDEEDFGRIFSDKENMNILRNVIQQVQLPTWIGRVPRGIGTAAGGKLKADEWVILFQTMIIPALILISHNKNTDPSNILTQKAVDNAFHLISVLNIVRQLEVTHDDVRSLQYHLKRYRQGLSQIYGSFPVLPNQHMALHMARVIKMFGPAPQWTAWNFERLNGLLTQIPNNNHPGGFEFSTLHHPEILKTTKLTDHPRHP